MQEKNHSTKQSHTHPTTNKTHTTTHPKHDTLEQQKTIKKPRTQTMKQNNNKNRQ
jgi:hypothetical protein